MVVPTFKSCSFQFGDPHSDRHLLQVWVTPSLSLEWKLYINDSEVGRRLDTETNILLHKELTAALDYIAVLGVYNDILTKAPKP
jgi:hypothetical protein